jgi:hypothetical protein
MVSPKTDETRQNFSTNRAKVEIISEYVQVPHRLNMELDLQSLFGLLCIAVTLAETRVVSVITTPRNYA